MDVFVIGASDAACGCRRLRSGSGQGSLDQEAVRLLGDYQVRNLGTIGGAIVEADPAGDWGPVILALNGQVLCLGPAAKEKSRPSDFFTFAYSTRSRARRAGQGNRDSNTEQASLGDYIKLERIAGDFAIVKHRGAGGYRQRRGLPGHRHRPGRSR